VIKQANGEFHCSTLNIARMKASDEDIPSAELQLCLAVSVDVINFHRHQVY
jgi:hypothetical protein